MILLLSSCAEVPRANRAKQLKTESSFTINIEGERRRWTQSELLSHSAATTLKLLDRSAYEGETKVFRVVPVRALFEGLSIPPNQAIEYQTSDGFSSSIEPERLLGRAPRAVAYLAVEDPHKPWSNFKGRNYGAGPFYLVWKDPEASEIGREEWPFKLTGFKNRQTIEERYPKLLPGEELPVDHPVRSGYLLFLKNCFPCHKLDGEGQASFGPDLNQPLSPTEYMAEGMVEKYVRDPQSLRQWSGSKMPGFDTDDLSDEELSHIVRYLEYKASHRPT